MLFSLLGLFSKASAKLIATFILVIVIMILCFAFAPGLITGMQDFVESINEHLRTPPILDKQGLVLYRTLVNENTIFGILMTLISRAFVEFFAFLGGRVFGIGGKGLTD